MLKKLVKYGNSTALILDKAILELLEIKEGSIIKISTDGKSITLTPHTKIISESISKTITHQETTSLASIENAVKKTFEQYKKYSTNYSKNEQKKLETDFKKILQKIHTLALETPENPDFNKEFEQLKQKMNVGSPEHVKAYHALKKQYFPELFAAEQELVTFGKKHPLLINGTVPELSKKQQESMQQELLEHFQKYSHIFTLEHELLNNIDYQHEAQLLAEKFDTQKDADRYLKALKELKAKYYPEFEKSEKAVEKIISKYALT